MGLVYSYLRFSSQKQASGASASRQLDYARKWAADNGMVLDESLTMRDEGLSAYSQKHIKSGALGTFIEAINAGKIPAGSVLVVEGLDRLSRAAPTKAQAQLQNIIDAGVEVVTASDGKRYSSKSQLENPMDLVYSLLVMIRAHEESATKAARVRQAIARKCRQWESGQKVTVPSGKAPSWVRATPGGFELIPERAAAMRRAIALYISGYGPLRILREMESFGIEIVGRTRASNIDHLLTKQPELFRGNRPVSVLGENFLLKGYYPALLNDSEYANLTVAIANRKQKPRTSGGKSLYPPLFTGMGKGACGSCGDWIVSQNQVRTNKDGSKTVYRRVRCPKCELASSNSGNRAHMASCFAKPLEEAIFTYCTDQFNLASLLSTEDTNRELASERAEVIGQIADCEGKLKKLTDAAMEGDLPKALIAKMLELESTIERLRTRKDAIDAEATVVSEKAVPKLAKEWADLKTGALALDYDCRMKARRLVDDTFAGIQVFFKGALPTTPAGCVDLLLIAKNGSRRLLSISRKSGLLVRGLNFDKHRCEGRRQALDQPVANENLLPD